MPAGELSPAEWGEAMGARYVFDVAEQQIVRLAVLALTLSHDETIAPAVRLAAAGRFTALLRALDLPEEDVDEQVPGVSVRAFPRRA